MYHDSFGFGGEKRVDIDEAVAPLLQQLRHYDRIRGRLEHTGGHISLLGHAARSLSEEFTLSTRWGEETVSLSSGRKLRTALRAIDHDLHLSVRRLETGMPVFYLCRLRQDYWAEYSLVVEDIYLSPGYTFVDERFVKLLDAGHERYYLRLSPFRGRLVHPDDKRSNSASRREVDDHLYRIGRHVLQAAWHEDQRIGMQVARTLKMTNFRNAVELLYLCLSGELCELRGAVDEDMLFFFEVSHPQAALRKFLGVVGGLDGGALSDLPQQALKLYVKLSRVFSCFIQTEIPWRERKAPLPLYKLILANFSRLPTLQQELRDNECLRKEAEKLEEVSFEVIGKVMEASVVKDH
jgi:hypothetical protein